MCKKCIICGEQVNYFENVGVLDGAGTVELYFEYGSENDMDSYKSYIHDTCFSKIKERVILTESHEDFLKRTRDEK